MLTMSRVLLRGGIVTGGASRIATLALRRTAPGAYVTHAVSLSMRWQATSNAASGGASDEDFHFDPMASIKADISTATQAANVNDIVDQLAPNAPPEAKAILRAHFSSKPVNRCIVADTVIVTHIQNAEGVDEKNSSLSNLTLDAAIKLADDNKLQLVQMAMKGNVAYCRLKREFDAALKSIEHLMVAANGNAKGRGNQAAAPTRSTMTHAFRDVADSHFVDWRSKKIVDEMKRGHPIKLQMEEFASVPSAIEKMKEMLAGIHAKATAAGVMHHHTGLNVSERELVVLLSPSSAGKSAASIRHPSEADWQRAEQRFTTLTGGKGTYVKQNNLKPRNIGAREYPTDKFGRRKS